MQKLCLTMPELYEALKDSTVVEVRINDSDAKGRAYPYDIRKKKLVVNMMYAVYEEFFGYNIEGIKHLSKGRFEDFMKHKDQFEKMVISNYPCIVTTVGVAGSRSLVKGRKFKRIVMDEATMIKEHEAFLAT